MSDIETALQLIDGLKPGELRAFDEVDPFNNVRVEGFVSHRQDHRYGALAILRVDGKPVPQRIFCTPKLSYPFDKSGQFHFPPRVKSISAWEKVDGTNVLAYKYHDAEGRVHTSYKTRLCPFIRSTRFGDFICMWQEILSASAGLRALCETSPLNLSFEMYGSRNPILVLYDVPLATKLLFGIRDDGLVVPPDAIRGGEAAPRPDLLGRFTSDDDPTLRYMAMKQLLESGLTKVDAGGRAMLSGQEGAVWYVEDDKGCTILYKCKPPSVEEIHWAGGMSRNSIVTTCWNALESTDDLTFESLRPLLLEEWTEAVIDEQRRLIEECIQEVCVEAEFRASVRKSYEACRAAGHSIETDKPAAMRFMSQHFDRSVMSKVYWILSH